MRFQPTKPRLSGSLPEQVQRAIDTVDALEAAQLVRTIALSAEPDDARAAALLNVLSAKASASNVVSACLMNLSGLGQDALRKGIRVVLSQPDLDVSELPKLSAVSRLIALSPLSRQDALAIADFFCHRNHRFRWHLQREIEGLPQGLRRELLQANEPNVRAGSENAKYLQLFLRAAEDLHDPA